MFKQLACCHMRHRGHSTMNRFLTSQKPHLQFTNVSSSLLVESLEESLPSSLAETLPLNCGPSSDEDMAAVHTAAQRGGSLTILLHREWFIYRCRFDTGKLIVILVKSVHARQDTIRHAIINFT
jgi:hypothetical protein